MELNLVPLLYNEGKKMFLDMAVRPETRPDDSFEILTPVQLKGHAVNIGGTIELTAEAKTDVRLTCDRCAEKFVQTFIFPVEERLKKEEHLGEQENPDLTMFPGNEIDLDQLVYSSLVLNLPSKNLCSEDCKGLCPQCGTNLNQGKCECDQHSIDPRFDILDQLLQ